MTFNESAPDLARVEMARARLAEPTRSDSPWPLLAASALLAVGAVTLAAAVILGPFWQVKVAAPAISASSLR